MLERGMTLSMLQAERDLAKGWALRAGGFSLSGSDLLRARGTMSQKDIDLESILVIRLLDWEARCPSRDRRIVLAMAVHGDALLQVAEDWHISRQTVIRCWHRGLDAYTAMSSDKPQSPLAQMKWHAFKKKVAELKNETCNLAH